MECDQNPIPASSNTIPFPVKLGLSFLSLSRERERRIVDGGTHSIFRDKGLLLD
jgi:hypothetical protein